MGYVLSQDLVILLQDHDYGTSIVWSNDLPFTSNPPPATIVSLNPTMGSPGTQVTITGTGFGATQGASRVELGTQWGNVVSWTDTQIVAQVVTGAASGVAYVNKSSGRSNLFPFPMTKATITSVTPTILTVGGQITITGTNFGGVQGSGQVFVGALGTSPTITSWTDTQIVGTVVAGTRPGSLYVRQSGELSSNAIPITMAPGTITSVTPTTMVPGTQITIVGSGFGTSQGSGQVFIGSQATQPSIITWSDSQIVATVAAGTLSGGLWIQQNGVTTNSIPIVIADPIITSVAPPNGPVGTQVTITGSGFGATQGNGSVYLLGTQSGTVVSWSDTQIVATVATGSSSGLVLLRQNSVYSNSVSFAVSNLNITSISPPSGIAGTPVTISGAGFGSSQGTSKVQIGTALGTVTSWTDTQIVATVATGSQSGTVQVYKGSYWSNALNITLGPIVGGISPTSGPIGASVTITGSNFGSTPGLVTFNGTAASPTSWGPTSITVLVPAGATTGNVVVTVGGVASTGINFTVAAPIHSIPAVINTAPLY